MGATFYYQPYPLDTLPIAESDFCAILSNLLDNVVEEVSQCFSNTAEGSVSLALARMWSIFFITCENYADPTRVKLVNGNHVSSKTDAHYKASAFKK